jgi:hypothetical protein
LNDGFGGFAGGVVISDIFWRVGGWLVSSCSGVRWLEWSENRIFGVLLFGWGGVGVFLWGVYQVHDGVFVPGTHGFICTRYTRVYLYQVQATHFVPGTLIINTMILSFWHSPFFYF